MTIDQYIITLCLFIVGLSWNEVHQTRQS